MYLCVGKMSVGIQRWIGRGRALWMRIVDRTRDFTDTMIIRMLPVLFWIVCIFESCIISRIKILMNVNRCQFDIFCTR